MSDKNVSDDNMKMGIGLWVTFCGFVCIWFLSRFVKGRSQLNYNLHVIEDGLKRMQESIDQRQRENSIGYVENLDEITACLKENFNFDNLKQNIFTDENGANQLIRDSDPTLTTNHDDSEQDKKND